MVLAAACIAAGQATAQFTSSSGTHFSSAGAAYMNTTSWSSMSRTPAFAKAMRDAEANANAKAAMTTGAGSRTTPPTKATPSGAATGLSIVDFTPVPEERAKAIETLVGQIPAGARRDAERARFDALTTTFENTLAGRRNKLAEATFLLIGMSLKITTGQPLEAARAQDIVAAINTAYAADSGFRKLDDRQQSRMFYLYAASTAATVAYTRSADPAEARVGKAIAQSTLRSLGIPQ
jgi:hypothetical protein